MQIKTDYLVTSPSRWEALAPYSMNPTEITFHNTYNDASALNEVKNVYNNSTGTSFHTAVDDKEVQQVIPFNRNAWHSGDGGSGTGNRKSIGVEICYSKSGGERYRKAELNAIDHISDLMVKFNIPIEKVKTHQERNGKYCPHRMLDEGRVSWFKEQCRIMADKKRAGSNKPKEEVKPMKWTLKTGGVGISEAQECMNKLSEFNTKGALHYEGEGIFYVTAEPVEDRNKLGALYWYFNDYRKWYVELYQV